MESARGDVGDSPPGSLTRFTSPASRPTQCSLHGSMAYDGISPALRNLTLADHSATVARGGAGGEVCRGTESGAEGEKEGRTSQSTFWARDAYGAEVSSNIQLKTRARQHRMAGYLMQMGGDRNTRRI